MLVVLVGSDAGRRIEVGEGLIIGRDVDGRGLVMDEGVSRRHLRVSRQADGTHLVEDLGSRNGTYVNGQRIEAAPVRSGDKIAVGSGTILLFTLNDRYEEQVLRAQKQQSLGELAGSVAQDFGNVVAAIVGNIDYLRTSPGRDDTDECLQDLTTAARRASQLTRQLLSLARKRDVVSEPVDIAALIDEAAAVLRRRLPGTIDLTASAPARLSTVGDPAQLMQVLLNIGRNAGHAMPDGGHLRVTARRCSSTDAMPEGMKSSRTLRIDVEDDGEGMDKIALARAFEPFFTTRTGGDATGLGLSIVHSVVADHGGDVQIRSRVGEGTCVSVFLPAIDATRPHRAAAQSGRTRLEGSVLVVDAEQLVRDAARRLLRSFGLNVWLAADLDDAAECLQHAGTNLDVVLLSAERYGPSWPTTVSALRAKAPRARLVVSTVVADPKERGVLERLDIEHRLSKPWDADRLWDVMHAALTPGE